jgi:transketolase, bacterial and yeast
MDTETVKLISNEARGICLDMVAKANSGHLGLPLGCADAATVLFGQFLNFLPKNPRWINRDRFVLSAGHGSALLYTYLHLSGYDVSLDDLKQFRQWGSKTPGHPEFGATPGVEATTGPLGQGIGNAVGIALSQKKLAAEINTSDYKLIDNYTVCLCGDGCLQEGVGQESVALAGLWKLDNLILIYDNNHVTLDGDAALSQCEDTEKRFEALGWDVVTADGHNADAILQALNRCRCLNGKPHLLVLNTIIGYGLSIAGTSKAHGPSGIKEITSAKQTLGLDPNHSFFISENTRRFFEKRRVQLQKSYNAWLEKFEAWANAFPEKAQKLSQKPVLDEAVFETLKTKSKTTSTRVAAGEILNQVMLALPDFITCTADLFDSVKNNMQGGALFSAEHIEGRNITFGIREHAMGAVLNGMAYDGFFRVVGSTFFAFSDYLKPALRIAALSHLPVWYFFSHDSIAVGEDGPTHQPIEQLAGLRSLPNVYVFRPADYDELLACFACALKQKSTPCIFVLSRQKLPLLEAASQKTKIDGARLGAYVLKHEVGQLSHIFIASGSEVELALQVADRIGEGARVVSMPCMELFRQQSEAYKQSVLPPSCRNRMAIEAASCQPWFEFVGLDGQVVGLDHFGASAPEAELKQHFHFTPEHCFELCKAVEKK